MKRKDIKELTGDKLIDRLNKLREEVSVFNIQKAMKQEKNTNYIGTKRKLIARILTKMQNEK